MSKSRPSSAKVAPKSAKSAAQRQTVSTRKPAQARSAPKPTKPTPKQAPATKSAPAAPAAAPTVKPAPGTAAISRHRRRGPAWGRSRIPMPRSWPIGCSMPATKLRAHRVVSDAPTDIRAALVSLTKEASVIIATGGLGPTEDDRTVGRGVRCARGRHHRACLFSGGHEAEVLCPRVRADPEQPAPGPRSRGSTSLRQSGRNRAWFRHSNRGRRGVFPAGHTA